jgi:hypothetical protein
MDRQPFIDSLSDATPPSGLSLALQALWHDAKGDWDTAHERAQEQENREGAWVHAYLHRKEGDASNAAYWYRHAGKPVATCSLEAEWAAIVDALLSEGST